MMKREIEVSTTIGAPPERVWRILTDIEQWPAWNPFITTISGSLQPDSRLSVQIVPPGKKGMTFKPTVLVVRTDRELRWLGHLLIPGIFDGEHYFLLEPDRQNRTRFTQGEKFGGVLVVFFRNILKSTEAGFRLMNDALKAQAEKGA